MGNKFLSWLSHAEQAFVKGITVILHIAESEGEVAVAIFAPELGPLFNTTVAAVVMAGQKWAALGKQSGTGQQKLADAIAIAGPVIAQGLKDAGQESSEAEVAAYVNAVVKILNVKPALVELQKP